MRVIDFFPDELENFASYDESLKDWSWGFSLRVEDGFLSDISNSSIDSSSKPRPWLLVDNSNAQFLLDLDADEYDTITQALANMLTSIPASARTRTYSTRFKRSFLSCGVISQRGN